MAQSQHSSSRISAPALLTLFAAVVAIMLMAVGAYLDAQQTTLWSVEPTPTPPLSYPCSPLADGTYLPPLLQLQYEAQCKPQPK